MAKPAAVREKVNYRQIYDRETPYNDDERVYLALMEQCMNVSI